MKWYAVAKGRKTGIFTSWEETKYSVSGHPSAVYKSFSTEQQAEEFLQQNTNLPPSPIGLTRSTKDTMAAAQSYFFSASKARHPDKKPENFLAVDAACNKNPGGDVEYRLVRITGKKPPEILHSAGPLPNGTNNIGEFLALVEALRFNHGKTKTLPIYTDSITALAWIRKQKANTTHKPGAELAKLVQEAEDWLHANSPRLDAIHKWQTKKWGEIPADYGRK